MQITKIIGGGMLIITYQFNSLLHYLTEGDFLIGEANKFRVKPKLTTNYKKKKKMYEVAKLLMWIIN